MSIRTLTTQLSLLFICFFYQNSFSQTDTICSTGLIYPELGLTTPLQPGQAHTFCFEVTEMFSASMTCPYIQGVVPIFGDCWDLSNFDGSTATITVPNNSDGVWEWWDECDPGTFYDAIHPNWGTYTNLNSGLLELCELNNNAACTQLSPDNPCMPGGWYYTGHLGSIPSDCNCNPATTWGDGILCDNQGPFIFCIELTTKNWGTCTNFPDCELGFKVFTDAEIGDWSGIINECFDEAAYSYTHPIDCCPTVISCDDNCAKTDDIYNPSTCDCTHIPNNLPTDVNTFTGLANSNNWNDALNWSLGVVPSLCHHVDIPNGFDVIIYSGDSGICHTMHVMDGGNLHCQINATLDVVAD